VSATYKARKIIASRAKDNFFFRSNNNATSRLYLQALQLERLSFRRRFSFVSFNDLMCWTNDWVRSFSKTYDLVVGVPRSGLLVANIIALKLGLPLTTPTGFDNNQFWASKRIEKVMNNKRVLLVDDSVESGKSIDEAFSFLSSYNTNCSITKAALIVTKSSAKMVDFHYKVVPQPRLFEWNIMHSKKGKTCSDLDGVICENCPPKFDGNENLYVKWIQSAKPYLIPSFELDAIVSSRLEKYRSETEDWLKKQDVHYKELILWDVESKASRKGKHAQHKISWLLKLKPDLFFESSLWEAQQIHANTKIPTLCVDNMLMFS